MTINQARALARTMLKNVPDRDIDAAWILGHVCGVSRSALSVSGDRELNEKQESLLMQMLERRANREPLQYIFGSVPFVNITLACDKRALIPRDETALLAEEAIRLINEHGYKTVLDLCTGSGCIGLAVKHNCPQISLTCSDISDDALDLARENANALGIDAQFVCSDLFKSIDGNFDCVLSNPPYVCTPDIDRLERELYFEPENALDGGSDGFDFYRDIIPQAHGRLNSGGMLMLEAGIGQADGIELLMLKNSFVNSFCQKDYSGIDRLVCCFKP